MLQNCRNQPAGQSYRSWMCTKVHICALNQPVGHVCRPEMCTNVHKVHICAQNQPAGLTCRPEKCTLCAQKCTFMHFCALLCSLRLGLQAGFVSFTQKCTFVHFCAIFTCGLDQQAGFAHFLVHKIAQKCILCTFVHSVGLARRPVLCNLHKKCTFVHFCAQNLWAWSAGWFLAIFDHFFSTFHTEKCWKCPKSQKSSLRQGIWSC